LSQKAGRYFETALQHQWLFSGIMQQYLQHELTRNIREMTESQRGIYI